MEESETIDVPPFTLGPQTLPTLLSQATSLPLTGSRPHVRLPSGKSVQRLRLTLDGENVVLSTWPAELQPQARAFYSDPSRVARVIDLTSAGAWAARPNGHLSYWLAAPERRWYFRAGTLDTADYMHQWQEDLGEVHSYRRDEVETELWPWLRRRGYAGESDRAAMQEFLAQARPVVHLRPGVWLSRRWPLQDARRLHDEGEFVQAVRGASAEVLDTLGEQPLG